MILNPWIEDRTPSAISFTDDVVHRIAEGLGFNWYSCFRPETYPAPDDDDGWQRVFAHADWLNIGFVRYGQSAAKISDGAGGFVPGDASLAQLGRVDAWAADRGISLILDPFSVPKAFRYEPWEHMPCVWRRQGVYSPGVADLDGYVSRFVVPYVRHVVEEMGCRSIRWFNCVNEPLRGGHLATPDGVDDHVRYVEMLAAIRQGLDEAGLSAIGQMAPDTHTHTYWPIEHMLRMGADPDPHIQAYCMHHYHSHFDWDAVSDNIGGTDPMSRTIDEQLTAYCRYAHDRGKPYLVTELGMFHYGWSWGDPAGIARHDNVILELEFIVRALGRGADGVLRWSWINPGDLDGWWQLIRTVDGSFEPLRGPYGGYGTLYRHVDRQAAVLATRVQRGQGQPDTLHAVAVANPDGSRSLCVINDAYANPAAVTVRFASPAGGTLRKVVCDPVRKCEPCPPPAALADGQAEWADILSPMSLTVYTTKPA